VPESTTTKDLISMFVLWLRIGKIMPGSQEGKDVTELRPRIRWQDQVGIPFDPKNFSTYKSPLRR
jgi:hypothetical protein